MSTARKCVPGRLESAQQLYTGCQQEETAILPSNDNTMRGCTQGVYFFFPYSFLNVWHNFYIFMFLLKRTAAKSSPSRDLKNNARSQRR